MYDLNMNNGGVFNDLRNEINNFSIDRRIKKMTGKLVHQCVIWEPLLDELSKKSNGKKS